MKNTFKFAMWMGVAAMLTITSCSRREEIVPEGENAVIPGTVVQPFRMTVESGDPSTKTVISEAGDSYNILWQAGDELGVFEVGNGIVQAKASSAPLEAPGETAIFNLDLAGDAQAPYSYTFVYPSSALDKSGTGENAKYRITIPSKQTFESDSFDISADVLVSEFLTFPAERPTSVSARFARLGGTARMVIKAPATEERIERISFSTTEANLAGSYYLDLSNGDISDGVKAQASKNLQLTPAAATTYAGEIVVWFRLAEVTLSKDFTVIVRTDSKTYTKTVDLASASRTLTFEHGKLTKFNVNMNGVVGEENTYEGVYAEFTAADAFEHAAASNYDTMDPFSKPYGDMWSGIINRVAGGFYLKGGNDSYLALPIFSDEIDYVEVTLAESAAGRGLYLTSSASGTSSDALASIATVAEMNVYYLDVSEEHVHTAFLRVSGSNAAKISKVAVISKKDAREALAAPTQADGEVDDNIKNMFHLQWNSVEDASGYLLTYTTGTDSRYVVVPAEETEIMTFDLADLDHSKTYSLTVAALADNYFALDSAPVAFKKDLTTGTAPEGYFVDVFTAAVIKRSTYGDWNPPISGPGGSGAIYIGNSTTDSSGNIQIRGSNNSGICTTDSYGYVRSVTITFDAQTTNTVDVYGNNTAYTAVSNLYGTSTQGVLVGSAIGSGERKIVKISFSDNYRYFGLRSRKGACYIESIRVEWSNDGVPTAVAVTGNASNVKATSATLSGSYTNAVSVPGIYEAGFYYRAEGDTEWLVATTDGSEAMSGEFSLTLGSLAESTKYIYKAYILEFDSGTQTYVEHFGAEGNFTTLSKSAFTPGGWLEIPAHYNTSAMAGTTTSSLGDLYQVTHYANMKGSRARNYTMLYDPEMYASYWVAYPLCKAHLGSGRDEDWGFDPVVPKAKQTTVEKGYGVNAPSTRYSNQHYARGHQLPNADRNGVDEMMAQTYFSTNMTPQLQHGFNGGVWANLETAVRSVIENNADTVYVVTGAAFRKRGGNETITTITSTRDGKVLPVPNYYWKVLLRVKWNGNAVSNASGVAFWLEHRDTYDNGGTNYLPYVTTVDQVEEWTGFDFFANISEGLQAAAESNANWSAFKSF